MYDEVTVSIVAVRPNQLLSLTLTDSEGDAVGLAPPFVSLRYDYSASVAQPDRQRHGNARRANGFHDDPQRPGRNQRRRRWKSR